MRPFVGAFAILAVVLASCGGSTPNTGGGGGGGGGGDLPNASTVIFGSAFDPTTLVVSGKTGTVKQGTVPLVAVGRVFTARPPSEVTVTVGSGSRNLGPRPVTASNSADQADLFASDLSSDNLGPGTWVVDFKTSAGKIVASGFLVVTP
jgi:hypothetical protein